MTNYATKQNNLVHFLDKQFNSTLNDINIHIKIQEIKDIIIVNDCKIYKDKGVWWVGENFFYLKKSAVAYAICLENNDRKKANRIYILDNDVSKYSNNIIFYKHSLRSTKSIVRRRSLSHRIIEDTYRLKTANAQLSTDLKTVNIT